MANEANVDPKIYSIFDKESFSKTTQGIQVSQLMKLKQVSPPTSEDVTQIIQELNVSGRLFCSYCDTSFPDQLNQRQHYKEDWHRYNLKQHLANKKLVSEERFFQIAENDDVSSISGSESDSETDLGSVTEAENLSDERVSYLMARRARILFENEQGHMLALYQCLLLDKKSELPSEDQLVALAQELSCQDNWLIIMLGGGHMAAAIFKGNEAIRHKTFHCYTVRAKQGGGQSSKDSSGRHCKSAGASLRRYNEQALAQHVQDILTAWSTDIATCQFIFYRAVGPFNRGVLFGGKSAPLNKFDPRLRTVPFPTRRATFSEVQRVHGLLSSVTVYESPEVFKSSLISPRRIRREDNMATDNCVQNPENKIESPRQSRVIDRAKSRPSPERALPDIVTALAALETSDSEYDEDQIMRYNNQEIYFSGSLKEYEDTVPKKNKKRKKKKNQPPEQEIDRNVKSFSYKVFTACESGSTTLLLLCFKEEGSGVSEAERKQVLDQLTPNGLTLLQAAAQKGYKDIVWILLENGANPCVKDSKAMTAYDFALDKETRNIFRKFMGEFPDMYDYSKSHIPSALTDTVIQEQAEKRRALRKAKRQKEKERRIADEPRKQEEEEKRRFLELSDREKRALAAERRILAAARKTSIVLTRCYICATDITGKVPFTYDNFLFCSMDCLKAHRKQHSALPKH